MQAGIGNVYEKKRYYIKIKMNIDIIIYDIILSYTLIKFYCKTKCIYDFTYYVII